MNQGGDRRNEAATTWGNAEVVWGDGTPMVLHQI